MSDTVSIPPTAPATEGAAAGPPAASPLSRAAKARLLASLLGNYLFLFAIYAGVVGILLPQQLSLIDADSKVVNFAIVTSISAVFTLFVQPVVGALSDRTRSRLGRRAPWIVFGGVGGGVATIALQFSQTVFGITVLWVIAQVLLNVCQGPLSTTVSDRVDEKGRATASSFIAVGTSIGAAGGVVVAGQLLNTLGVAYTIFGVMVIAMSVLFVLLNPDRTKSTKEIVPFHWGEFLRSFWVDPRKHPDYAWAFFGRFFMILGYQGVVNYQFYILTDYIGLDATTAGSVSGILSICSMITVVIGTLVIGRISDKLGRRKIFVFTASIIIALGVLIPVFVPTIPAMIAYSIVIGIGYGAYAAVDFALMVDVLPSQSDAGKDLGGLNVASNVPQAITPLVAATLLSLFNGQYVSIFLFAAIMVIVSSFMVLPIRSVR